MAIKWINTNRKNPPAEGPQRPPRERGWLSAAAGLLAFVLGLSMVIDGCVFIAGAAANRNNWLADSLESDYQNTSQFRTFIADRLESMIVMGLGGPGGDWYGYSDYYGDFEIETYVQQDTATDWGLIWDGAWSSTSSAPKPVPGTTSVYGDELHSRWNPDKNLLYRVEYGGKLLYTNTDDDIAKPRADYNFYLHFNGEKVTITKDGSAVDVYGNGYYTEDSDWYVPGYQNFTLGEDCGKITITMAAISQPQVFITGQGNNGYYRWTNQLYWLCQGMEETRGGFRLCAVELSAGLLLLGLYWLLRRDKARADRTAARLTGKLWWEVKLLLIAALSFAICRRSYFGEVLVEAATAVTEGGMPIAWALREYGWGFGEFLSYLFESGGRLLALLWAVYFLLINDWRYNKTPWRHGVGAMLTARSLKHPLQKRISRLTGGVVLLVAVLLSAISLAARAGSDYLGWFGWIIGLPALLVLCYLAYFSRRLRGIWTDIGSLTDQIAAVRAGDLEHLLPLEEGRDLAQAADDLNHIQQGLQSALEEQTRSERMKVELITNVSHDLKTPLTSLISYTDLLAKEELPPPAGEYVAILQQKAQRLSDMVQDVFAVSKAAAGQLPLKIEILDYGKLLRQTLADMSQPIEDSGLTLRTDIPETPVPISADGTRLYRVFQNLIGNALKYSLPGSRIYLTLRCTENQAEAILRNTSAHELIKGTDYTARFVRGDESRTDGGSGLGLSIAASFTEACNGKLIVETEADLFTVRVTFSIRS